MLKRILLRTSKFLLAVLYFLNLLEPNKKVLSLSKLFMWLMMVVLVYVIAYHPQNIAAVISAAGSQFIAAGNYAYRRYIQHINGAFGEDGYNSIKQDTERNNLFE